MFYSINYGDKKKPINPKQKDRKSRVKNFNHLYDYENDRNNLNNQIHEPKHSSSTDSDFGVVGGVSSDINEVNVNSESNKNNSFNRNSQIYTVFKPNFSKHEKIILDELRENIVDLSMDENVVEFSAKSSQAGSAFEQIETYKYDGEPFKISFNSEFVLSAVKGLGCEDVVLKFEGSMKPFVISDPSDDSVTQVITPVRTHN